MDYVAVILPSLVVGLIFWFAMRALFNVDRAERQALAVAEREADALAEKTAGVSGSDSQPNSGSSTTFGN